MLSMIHSPRQRRRPTICSHVVLQRQNKKRRRAMLGCRRGNRVLEQTREAATRRDAAKGSTPRTYPVRESSVSNSALWTRHRARFEGSKSKFERQQHILRFAQKLVAHDTRESQALADPNRHKLCRCTRRQACIIPSAPDEARGISLVAVTCGGHAERTAQTSSCQGIGAPRLLRQARTLTLRFPLFTAERPGLERNAKRQVEGLGATNTLKN